MTSATSVQHPPHPCPACGYYMFSALNEQSEICRICGWQNDLVDLQAMYRSMGPNKVSLAEAQKNFVEIGVTEPRFSGQHSGPTENDTRDPHWRPLDRMKDTPRAIKSDSNRPEDLYYWYWN